MHAALGSPSDPRAFRKGNKLASDLPRSLGPFRIEFGIGEHGAHKVRELFGLP